MPRLSAEEIRQKRQEMGLTRKELGKLLGYSVHSLHNWERRDKARRLMPAHVETAFCELATPILQRATQARTEAFPQAA